MNGKRSSALGAAILAAVTLWPTGVSAVAAISGSTEAVTAASAQRDISNLGPCRRKGPLICCRSGKGVRCHRSLRERHRELDDLHDEWRDRHRRQDHSQGWDDRSGGWGHLHDALTESQRSAGLGSGHTVVHYEPHRLPTPETTAAQPTHT
ncbi:hypothetical protein SAMN05216275_104218 [Streptosporangium canum]|uniref:Secreted protein n=1 Tax=Streptosporangium canum TaxID=324952 RepID=A0A1I3K2K8_9ACTN|nr:hypothetical protein SAMN05216275_104218 [Streptosporangium canum]